MESEVLAVMARCGLVSNGPETGAYWYTTGWRIPGNEVEASGLWCACGRSAAPDFLLVRASKLVGGRSVKL